MVTPRVPVAAAAALFLERQQLDRPRGRRLTARSLERFASDVGGIQIDSINVLDRAHYLTAWSRFGAYERGSLDGLIQRRRVLFEYWAHAACFVPAADYTAWRRAMLDYGHHHTGWGKWLRKNDRVVRGVEDEIRARGPLRGADFAHTRKRGSQGWWDWKPAQHALHWLWMTGRIAVHSRVHFHKRYDLAERVLPGAAEAPPLSREEFVRWHFVRSLRAMGAATARDLRGYMTFPRQTLAERREALRGLVRSGEVVEIAIDEGRRKPEPWYALASDLPALARARRQRRPSRGTTLLAPFDSFLWHRERTSRLFGFDYRIEVYTPGHKRTHGYYTLPILHDGRLIGRLDAKNHREPGTIEVRHVSFEPWFASGAESPRPEWGPVARDAALAGLAETLQSLARFEGATRIRLGRVSPGALRGALKTALARAED